MNSTFDIELFDGHLIIEVDGMKVLVDTGSPATISKQSTLGFMGVEYPCQSAFGGLDTAGLSQLLHYDIDALMGLDILGNYYVMTDYRQRKITFSTEPIPFEAEHSLPFNRGMMDEMLIVAVTVKGQTLLMPLDTGAKISYIDESLTEGETMLEMRDDFYPMIGAFQTPVYQMDATVAGSTFPVTFGVLPKMLSMALGLANLKGILGFDLFNNHQVLLDFPHNTLHLR